MSKIHFLNFSIDLDLFQLTADSQAIDIGGRALDVLVFLAQNRDRVVSRDLLREEIWNGADLSPSAIPTAIMEIRRALDDDPRESRIVKSVRGRGYQFLPELKELVGSIAGSKLYFAGRDGQLRELIKAYREARELRASKVIQIVGEAGIGKTRLIQEFIQATQTTQSDSRPIVVRCSQISGAPPYWPWTQALKKAISSGACENAAFAKSVAYLASVHPEFRDVSTPKVVIRAPLDRFTLFNTWIAAIKSLGERRTATLIFEDIHVADEDSLDLLSCVVEELENTSILLIVSHRPPSLDDLRLKRIAEIGVAPSCTRLELPRLTKSDVSEILASMGHDRPGISDSLTSKCNGNPFYLTHVIRHIGADLGRPNYELVTRRLPMHGREIVERQLANLPNESRQSLIAAAVIGETFSLNLLAAALECSPASALTAIEPALRTELVRQLEYEFEFTHALLREALVESTEADFTHQLHVRIAEELQSRPTAGYDAARISDHLADAAPLSSPDSTVHFSRIAAKNASSRFAYTIARQYFERALMFQRESPEFSADTQCEIMEDLAIATLHTGDRGAARRLLFEAAQIARENQLPISLSRCALSLGKDFLSIEVGVYDEEHTALLQEAIGLLPDSEKSTRSKLLARLSQAIQWTRSPDSVEDLAKLAVSLAEETGDSNALVAALAARAESLHGPKSANLRLSIIRRLRDVSIASNDTHALLLAHTRALTAHLELGDIVSVEAENEHYRAIAARTELPQYRWYPTAHDSMLSLLRGELGESAALSAKFRKIAGENPDQNCIQTFVAHEALRAVEQDRASDIAGMIKLFAKEQIWMYHWRVAVPWFSCELRDYAAAQQNLNQIEKSDFDSMSREPGGGQALAMASEVAAALRDEKKMPQLYDLVAPLADRCATIGYGVGYFGSFARYAGLLARSLGDIDASIEHFKDACMHEEKRGAISWLAYAEADLAQSMRLAGASRAECDARLVPITARIRGANLPRALRCLESVYLKQ